VNTITARRPDKLLILITALLVGFGALMIYSSTSVVTPAMAGRHITNPLYYFERHVITIIMSLGAAYFVYRIRPELLGKASPVLLVLSLVLLGLVFTRLGISAGGARRWIRLWPSTFQPSEFVKLAMVIFLAWYLSRDFFEAGNFWVSVAVPIAVMGVFQAIFLKQPDFGGAVTLGVITLGMLFIAGARLKYLGVLSVGLLPVIYKLIQEPYRLKRVTSFIDPWSDAQGSGFQLVQSFIALGRGGLTGVGLGKSMQKLAFLPEMHTDFIFSIIGEELGFVAAGLVVALFCAFFIRGAQVASKMQERFHYLLAYGLSMMVAFQGLVNFGVVTGLLPTKGLPLPFISYGGSSLLVSMVAVGILLRLSRGDAPLEKGDRLKEALDRKKARRAVYGGAA
jgi:cell division protein FtsW